MVFQFAFWISTIMTASILFVLAEKLVDCEAFCNGIMKV